jgi:hypothetical protein
MGDARTYLDRHPELAAAVADAERLVTASRGTNLDPIIQALDQRLLAHDGDATPPVLVHLRRDLTTTLGLVAADVRSGQQVTAAIFCRGDDRVVVPLLAALDGGPPALVPTIAVTVFGGLRSPALSMASVLAALVTVRGLSGFCRDMGRPLGVDRLGPS